jgi:hypothetical protein
MAPQTPAPRPPSLRPSEPPPEARASWVTRFGSLTAAGAFAAALATIPAALRAGALGANVDTIGAWLSLAGVAVAPCIALAWIFRGAYTGLRAYAGPGAAARAAAIALWLTVVLAGLTAYGAVLRATTHHHGLAGTTYAIGAVALALGAGVVGLRVSASIKRARDGAQRGFALVSFALLFAVVALVASRLGRSESSPVVDALALLLALVFAGQPVFTPRKALAIVGPPIAATFILLGVATVRRSPPVQEALGQTAPIFAPLVRVVAGH